MEKRQMKCFDVVTASGNKIGSVVVDEKGGTLAMPFLDDFLHAGQTFALRPDPFHCGQRERSKENA